MVQWTWDEKNCMSFMGGSLKTETVQKDTYKYKGRLQPMRKGGFNKAHLEKEQNIMGGEDDAMLEGGQEVEQWAPYDFCQHPASVPRPSKKELMVPDNRIFDLFKKQIVVDFIFIRLILIGGNTFLILTQFINQ